MKNDLKVLALDIGSSSVKAGIVSLTGDINAVARVRFDRSLPFPEIWLNAMKKAFAAVFSAPSFSLDFRSLDSVIVSGAGPTLVAVDDAGKVSACLMWDDPVPMPNSPAPQGAERSIFFPRIAAMPEVFPGIEKKARRVFSGPEFAVFCLCGGECTVLPEARYIPAYWNDSLIEAAGFKAEAFPPFRAPGFNAGVFRQDASPYSQIFSGVLPDGIPIRAGLPDFAAALFGTGTVLPGKACDRAGTSEGLNVCLSAPVYAEGLRTLPSPVKGLWNLSCLFEDTGKEFSRFRNRFPEYRSLSYEEIFREISESPVIPPAGKHDSPAREVAEKICLKVKNGIEKLESFAGFRPEFVLSGGQAKNRIWNQMKADMTGAVFLLTQTENAELLGDAVTAFCAAEEYASYAEACSAIIRITERFEPDAERAALYREKHG